MQVVKDPRCWCLHQTCITVFSVCEYAIYLPRNSFYFSIGTISFFVGLIRRQLMYLLMTIFCIWLNSQVFRLLRCYFAPCLFFLSFVYNALYNFTGQTRNTICLYVFVSSLLSLALCNMFHNVYSCKYFVNFWFLVILLHIFWSRTRNLIQ